MPDKTYRGETTEKCRNVFVDRGLGQGEEIFSPRRSLRFETFSRCFDWGYLGSGAAQLALAVLLEETSPDEALRRYHDFKREILRDLPDTWQLGTSAVQGWLAANRAAQPLKKGNSCSF